MRALLSSSRRLRVLDHFRVPYEVSEQFARDGLHRLRARAGGPELLWSSCPRGQTTAALIPRERAAPVPIFARLVDDALAEQILGALGGHWTAGASIATGLGAHRASMWFNDDGSVFVPFDPDEVLLNYLSERYVGALRRTGTDWRRVAMVSYYRVRGLLPRALQIALRRRYARVQARIPFPRWPVETALHDFLDLVLEWVQAIVPEPVPTIAPWPGGRSWALVLTHDVETAAGLQGIAPVCRLERSLGLVSAWNFVPRRYTVSAELVSDLRDLGCEVGVHGLYHDGRDLESLTILRERLPGMHEAARRWNAIGFRAPATHRAWQLMPTLGFAYDSSYPDTDPFEPQAGGCCSWLPFLHDGVVELPITMPQDHTLFVILRRRGDATWVRKAELLRARGGMALLDTHPDYLTEEVIFNAYQSFLVRYADDPACWRALPREVNDWWRRRASSRLERTAGGWTVTGPAAGQARVQFPMCEPDQPRARRVAAAAMSG